MEPIETSCFIADLYYYYQTSESTTLLSMSCTTYYQPNVITLQYSCKITNLIYKPQTSSHNTRLLLQKSSEVIGKLAIDNALLTTQKNKLEAIVIELESKR